MQKIPFAIKELSIHKMPGFQKGIRAYRDLSPGINIVAGPNASGKSSTARMIQQVIWTAGASRTEAKSGVSIGTENWQVRIDSNHIQVQREGRDDQFTGLPPAETRDRYMLALHELVVREEKDLARQILRESAGGYDLDQAREELGYAGNISSRNTRVYKDYEQADSTCKQIVKQQKELKKAESRLEELERKEKEAREASSLASFFSAVSDWLEKKLNKEHWEDRLHQYPEVMSLVHGEEYKNLQALEEEMEAEERKIRDAARQTEETREELSNLQVPGGGVSDKVLGELKDRIEQQEADEREIKSLEEKITEAKTKEQESLKAIGHSLDFNTWKGIDLKAVARLDMFLQKAHQTYSARRFFETEIRQLERELEGDDAHEKEPQINSDNHAGANGSHAGEGQAENGKKRQHSGSTIHEQQEAGTLKEGIKTLSRWLQKQTLSGISIKWLVILVILAVLTALASIWFGWFGLSGLVLLTGMALYAYTAGSSREAALREADYRKLILRVPHGWDVESVTQTLEQLVVKLEALNWKETLREKLNRRKAELAELQGSIKETDEAYRQWVEQLGAAPDLPGEDLKTHSGLYWFLIHVRDWKEQHAEAEALKEKLKLLKERASRQLEAINRLFPPADPGNAPSPERGPAHLQEDGQATPPESRQVRDAAEAWALFSQIQNDEHARREGLKEMERQKQVMEESRQQIDRKSQKQSEIYQKLNLPEGEKEAVRALTGQLKDYTETRESYKVAEKLAAEKQNEVTRHEWYPHFQETLNDLSPEKAEEKREQYEKQSSGLEEIQKELTTIRTTIDNAKKNNALENALEKRDQALSGIEALYHNNLASITGHLLVEQLKKENREKNDTPVFNRAGELFNRITRGRYELLVVEENGETAFKAYDTLLGEGQHLHELSTGTRIQLVLSVRLAFIETQESTLTLPLLADELLANSDDARAKAIIDALVEISKEGRQVFYFTAQEDEVAKWEYHLKGDSNISYRFFTLSGQENERISHEPSEQPRPSLKTEKAGIPEPANTGHPEYGKQLDIPAFNLLTDETQQLHLWYLTEDTHLLYHCLVQGINRWGQLKSFLDHSGRIEGLNEAMIQHISEKASLLNRFQELYRQGRPRPVDREVLNASGAVSEKFIEAVTEKLEAVDRNPEKLLQALRNREVPRFGNEKINELEQYFHENGYLDDADALQEEEIRLRLQAMISRMNLDATEASRFLDRLTLSKHGINN